MRKNIGTAKIIIGVGIALLLACFMWALYRGMGIIDTAKRHKEVQSINDGGPLIYTTAHLSPNTVVEQTFSLEGEKIDAVGIFAATYARTNSGQIEVCFSTDNMSKKWLINSADLEDNSYCYFKLDDELSSREGQIAKIKIVSFTQSNEQSPTVYTTKNNNDEHTRTLTINDVPVRDETLCIKLASGTYAFVPYLYWSLCIIMLAVACGLYVLAIRGENKIEIITLVSVLALSLLYSLVFPPFSVPDEKVHYATAYSYSNKMMFDYSDTDTYISMRKDDVEMLVNTNVSVNLTDVAYAADNFSFAVKDASASRYPDGPMTYRLLSYFPQAIGITIGRLCHLGAYPTFYLARFFACAFFAVLLYIAVKIIPFNKGALAVIGVLPMTLHLAGSCSYDPYTIGMTFIMIAQFVKLIYGHGGISAKETVVTLIICLLAIPYKIVYFAVPCLALLIPRERFKKLRIATIASYILIGLAGILILQLPSRLNQLTGQGNFAAKDTYTLQMLIKNPLYTIKMYFVTLFDTSSWYYETMIGKRLGWLELDAPSLYIIFFTLLLLLAFVKKEDDEYHTFNIPAKILSGIIAVVTVAVTMLVLCIDHTSTSSMHIQGVQGRYFIPILPLVMLAVRNNTLVLKKDIDRYLVLAGGTANILLLLRVCLGMLT